MAPLDSRNSVINLNHIAHSELARQFRKFEEDIARSRLVWEGDTKPLLLEHLQSIQEATKLSVEVKIDQKIIPLEAIMFSFQDSLCGLCYNPEHASNIHSGHAGDISKIGAVLYFEQRYNGQIVIWMDYPYIDYLDRPLERKNELFTIVSQDKLDVEMIDKFMQDFLTKVNTWHRREYKPVLGQ